MPGHYTCYIDESGHFEPDNTVWPAGLRTIAGIVLEGTYDYLETEIAKIIKTYLTLQKLLGIECSNQFLKQISNAFRNNTNEIHNAGYMGR